MAKRGRRKGVQYKPKKYPDVISNLDKQNYKRRVKVRARQLKEGDWTLYLHVQYYHHGKMVQKYIKTEEKYIIHGINESRKRDKEIYNEMLFLRDQHENLLREDTSTFHREQRSKKIYFCDYSESHAQKMVEQAEAKGRSEPYRHGSNYKHMILHFRNFIKGDIVLAGIDEKICMDFYNYLLKKLSINSAGIYFSRLSAVLNTALKQRLIRYNPAAVVKTEMIPTIKEYLTMEELRKLEDTSHANTDIKNAFLFCCFSGLRASEMRKLKFKDIDFEKNIIPNFRQQKTLRIRDVFLGTKAMSYIEKQRDKYETLSILYRDEQKTAEKLIFDLPTHAAMNYALKAWARKSELKKHISFHTSRHTFATMVQKESGDIYQTKELIGHTNIKTTMVYAKLVEEGLRDIVDKIGRKE